MSDVAIRVEGLGKRYRIGPRERYHALRDVLARSAARLLRRGDGRPDPESRWIWALEDVSFEVKEGEVVGIIGRNGAGKTTLLKILARITKPTKGYAEVRGRVGSLLEVGTGFHPELTGRENVYLSGAVLGMTRREIERKFDEIVDFAGVDRFIDTPLKYYSTGMQMRLAFAVAAHLDPEILLVDEVLAVGDLEFQRKCLGKMEGVGSSGRTVVFVSHQMNQVRRLCGRVMWLDDGQVRQTGRAEEVTLAYEADLICGPSGEDVRAHSRDGVSLSRWYVENGCGHVLEPPSGPTRICIEGHALRPSSGARCYVGLRDRRGIVLFGSMASCNLEPGSFRMVLTFEPIPLAPGAYYWDVRIFDGHRWYDFQPTPPLLVAGREVDEVFGWMCGPLEPKRTLEVYSGSSVG